MAHVPGDAAWDLVEYLANQRVHVQYSFEASHVVVRFPHANMASAAELLERWSQESARGDRYVAGNAPRKAAAHA
jgi:hypothetical protein